MAQAVLMPQVGQDIETAVLVEWTTRVGDAVKADDVIALVESDKATFEVQALVEGVLLKQLLGEGDEGKVLEPIAWIGRPGEEIEPAPARQELLQATGGRPSERAATVAEAPCEGPRAPVAPAARRLAREHGVDLSTVKGTGPGGRIVSGDVRAVLARREQEGAESDRPQAPGSAAGTEEVASSKLRRGIP
ncbi:MAG: E3 binding domain-containing protein [Sedimentisphaerales bacterium]|nr:E3 binding domain-containing protein [Sedimentisphaerales bacterium]